MSDITKINLSLPMHRPVEPTKTSKIEKDDVIQDKVSISHDKSHAPTTGEKIGGYVVGGVSAVIGGAYQGSRGSIAGAVDGVNRGHQVGSDATNAPKGDVVNSIESFGALAAGMMGAGVGAGVMGPLGIPVGFAVGAAAGASIPTFAGALGGSVKGMVAEGSEGVKDGWKAGNRLGQEMVRYLKDVFGVHA